MNKIFSAITMLLVALAILSACIVNYIQAKDIQALQQQIVEISKKVDSMECQRIEIRW